MRHPFGVFRGSWRRKNWPASESRSDAGGAMAMPFVGCSIGSGCRERNWHSFGTE